MGDVHLQLTAYLDRNESRIWHWQGRLEMVAIVVRRRQCLSFGAASLHRDNEITDNDVSISSLKGYPVCNPVLITIPIGLYRALR